MGITLISSSKCKVFLASPFCSFQHNHIGLGVIFFSLSLSLSLTRTSFQIQLSCVFLQKIAPGGGRGGQGHGLTLGSIDDLCVCVCVPRLLCGTFKFPQSGVSACHLGGKAGSPQYKRTLKAQPENFCSLQLMHN